MVKNYIWNEEKNEKLKQERGVSFENVIEAIKNNQVLAITETLNKEKYPNQFVIIVLIRDYVYCVPYIKEDNRIFLKTIFPSRKMKKQFLGE
ncbi:toxin [Geminocystis sp. CENA526]|uniref:toxin n=1 Tax=Geminocystis sp. CENA526 TaxID=1355871 RepID=UPI003D6E9BC8